MGFQQGLSGLNSSSKALDVVGNNIANSGTVGFKTGSSQFADVFAASLNGAGAAPVGIGSKVAAVVQQFTQGNISVTNNPMDVAINGGGFFVMDDGSGGDLFARNGQFQLDKDGFIVSAQGLQLKGRMAVDGVVPDGAELEALRLFDPTQSLTGPPQKTGDSAGGFGVQANVNLDSRELPPDVTTFDYQNPASYNTSTSTTIYDSLGNPHTYSMFFVKTTDSEAAARLAALAVPDYTDPTTLAVYPRFDSAGATAAAAAAKAQYALELTLTVPPNDSVAAAAATEVFLAGSGYSPPQAAALVDGLTSASTWTVYATVTNPDKSITDLSDHVAGVPSIAEPVPLGVLGFDTTGVLITSPLSQTVTGTNLGYPGAITSPQTFNVNFTGSTQYGSPFTVNTLLQDGYASGTLAGFNIGNDGIVLGRFTNGQSKNVGQVVLATFRNPQGLQPLGDNVWARTPQSGDAIKGTPKSSGQYGALQSAALEDANVDLTAELVNMITLQRAYQANAQTIKTQDSILQTLVNLR